MDMMLWVWLGAAAVFGVVEAITTGMVSIWFAVGAVAALVATLLGAGLPLQLGLFIVVSAAVMLAMRKLAVKYIRADKTATNADRVLGAEAKVTEEINNLAGTGAVYVDGKTWSARSDGEELIPVGETVTVLRMEGVKLFVQKSNVLEEVK